MAESTLALFCVTLAAISILYGSVGQAGASGTIAAMALFGFHAATIKPTSLVLNVLVSVVVSQRFVRAGHVSWRLLAPFALASVPLAFLGGFLTLPPPLFNRLLGSLLLVAALPLFLRRDRPELSVTPPRFPQALLAGGAIGLLSGLTGMGGGVLIAPLLIHRRWARPQTAAGLSSVFILINSAAALLGHLGASTDLPPQLALLAVIAIGGGALGAQLGSVHLSATAIRRLLGSVLLLASLRLLFGP